MCIIEQVDCFVRNAVFKDRFRAVKVFTLDDRLFVYSVKRFCSLDRSDLPLQIDKVVIVDFINHKDIELPVVSELTHTHGEVHA